MRERDFLIFDTPLKRFACFYGSGWLEIRFKITYKRKQNHDGNLLRLEAIFLRIWGRFLGPRRVILGVDFQKKSIKIFIEISMIFSVSFASTNV